MGFWKLFEVASMPVLQVLIVCILGAFMATSYCNLLPIEARKSLNKIVFVIFTPSLMFASLAKTVTFADIVSWWFMPINVALTFFVGGVAGWILVKAMKPKPQSHLHGLIIATCSSGNLGNLLLILVPAVCSQDGSPFGDTQICSSVGLSYTSYSMALGGFFIWTYTYQLIRTSSVKYKTLTEATDLEVSKTIPNNGLDADSQTHLLKGKEQQEQLDVIVYPTTKPVDQHDTIENQASTPAVAQKRGNKFSLSFWKLLKQIRDELLAPPTIAAIFGFVFGAITWLRNLIVGDTAPLRVIQDSVQLLGDGTIPCITLILGGNLMQGLRSSKIKPPVIVGVIIVRYVILPAVGMGIVKLADHLGFLSADPLFRFVLMLQYTLPPAMNIGTMTQLFDVGQDECSVLFLWTYVVAAPMLAIWSTIFMSNL